MANTAESIGRTLVELFLDMQAASAGAGEEYPWRLS